MARGPKVGTIAWSIALVVVVGLIIGAIAGSVEMTALALYSIAVAVLATAVSLWRGQQPIGTVASLWRKR